jgi:hypothetical protein
MLERRSLPAPAEDLRANASAVWIRLRRSTGRVGVGLWFTAMLLVGATLLGRHLIALPRPSKDAALARAMDSMRGPADAGRWMAVHVLYAECQCSQRIAEHLLAGNRPPDLAERVLLIGRDADLEARFAAARIAVVRTDENDAAVDYHVSAVPLFVVVGPDGVVRYAGGYTERKQGPNPRDLEILADARAGREIPTLPVFGCAVSARLRSTLNPLGLP